MFTGIVEEVGTVTAIESEAAARRLRIGAETVTDDLRSGQSIAVNGACLTVERFEAGEWFEVFLAVETLERTYLGDVAPGDGVNLERALPADGRFDGHVVQGHVDGVATVTELSEIDEDWRLTVALPKNCGRYVVEKGSIALDGISLTVARRDSNSIDIAVIPTTYRETTIAEKSVGDPMHVEVDVLAKYVERLVGTDR